MIRINLGRSELKKGAASKKFKLPVMLPSFELDTKSLIILLTATAFALLPYLFMIQYKAFMVRQHATRMQGLNSRIEELKADIARFQNYKTEMESYQLQKKLVAERLAIVQQLLAGRNTPVSVLDAVGQSLPSRTWLDVIELTSNPAPKLFLSGRAYSSEEISDFVDKLSESVHLSDVNIEGMGQGTASRGSRIDQNFQVSALPKGVMSATVKSRSTASKKVNKTEKPAAGEK